MRCRSVVFIVLFFVSTCAAFTRTPYALADTGCFNAGVPAPTPRVTGQPTAPVCVNGILQVNAVGAPTPIPGPTQPFQVNVTNTPGVTIQNTPGVNVLNTPTVIIANPTAFPTPIPWSTGSPYPVQFCDMSSRCVTLVSEGFGVFAVPVDLRGSPTVGVAWPFTMEVSSAPSGSADSVGIFGLSCNGNCGSGPGFTTVPFLMEQPGVDDSASLPGATNAQVPYVQGCAKCVPVPISLPTSFQTVFPTPIPTLLNPCANPANYSGTAFNITATDTAIVAASGGTSIYVCSFTVNNTVATGNTRLRYGTTTTTPCDTGGVNLYNSGLAVDGANYSNAGFPQFKAVPATNNLCITFTGTGGVAAGSVTYVQQ